MPVEGTAIQHNHTQRTWFRKARLRSPCVSGYRGLIDFVSIPQTNNLTH
jgi:hypothetical protein